jgi:Na+/proline symporter
MTPSAILILIFVYFGLLFYISHRVSRKDDGNAAFFTANKNSKWYLVAFGMIGTALSGVTFISVPGEVGAIRWRAIQIFSVYNRKCYWFYNNCAIGSAFRLYLVVIVLQRYVFDFYGHSVCDDGLISLLL